METRASETRSGCRSSTPRCATASNRPGATMNVEEKLVIARQLEKLGVDVIEAGFAASSEGDFESVAASPRR